MYFPWFASETEKRVQADRKPSTIPKLTAEEDQERDGWARARRTILVADFVSIIAAALLYFFAVGGVRGFAFTLGLTTLVDLLVVFAFTKPLVTTLAKVDFFSSGKPLSGLSPKSLGLKMNEEA